MKQLERLLFLQGNVCFFCHERIPKSEESIEHLSARANGGQKADENCVVCCKSVNAALGSLSVKEKLRAILSQRSGFTCPRHLPGEQLPLPVTAASPALLAENLLPEAIANLKKRGDKRPAKLSALRNALSSSLSISAVDVLDALLQQLKDHGHVALEGPKVVYPKLKPRA